MTVLVLTEECDLTADRVITELARRDVPVFRCDLGWFPTGLSADFGLEGDRWSGVLRTPHRDVELAGVRSVWYRRPTAFRFPAAMSGPERQHAGWEARFGLGGVLASLPVLWVNHPSREADAGYKPWQLAVAAECGLRVPETRVTNDPEAVRRFAARFGNRIVVKTLGSNMIVEAGGPKVAHTRALSATDLSDLSGTELTTHLVQQWVDKAFEVRVTAVGDRLFAAAIDADSDAARIDWRADMSALSYRAVEVPEPVAAGVRAYLATFGLAYGAFDFVVTSGAEEFVFLECNPGGQYGWIEGQTGLPITAAVADLLASGRP